MQTILSGVSSSAIPGNSSANSSVRRVMLQGLLHLRHRGFRKNFRRSCTRNGAGIWPCRSRQPTENKDGAYMSVRLWKKPSIRQGSFRKLSRRRERRPFDNPNPSERLPGPQLPGPCVRKADKHSAMSVTQHLRERRPFRDVDTSSVSRPDGTTQKIAVAVIVLVVGVSLLQSSSRELVQCRTLAVDRWHWRHHARTTQSWKSDSKVKSRACSRLHHTSPTWVRMSETRSEILVLEGAIVLIFIASGKYN
jgi:hypothetical protein